MSRPPSASTPKSSKNSASKPNPSKKESSQFLLGIVIVFLSAIFLATQNVISRIFFVPSTVFNSFMLGGWLSPSLSNIVMLLATRMGLMALLLAVVAPRLYNGTFRSLGQLTKAPKLLSYVVGSGLCLFVGLISLYLSLSQVAAGIAIATFFIYPAVTVLLAWRFLQQRPQRYQLALMLVILCGVVLTTLEPATNSPATTSPLLGVISGLIAGLNFGLYGIFAEIVLQSRASNPHTSLHPVPFSLITFFIVSVFSALSLPLMPPIEVAITAWPPLLSMTLLSAAVTVTGYVLNNSGIRLIGASFTALISTSSPVLTALFAWLALQESLRPQQTLGVVVVTIGVAALSLKANNQK
ncbi:MAG: DMT family transporter [Phormidesmis sp.]